MYWLVSTCRRLAYPKLNAVKAVHGVLVVLFPGNKHSCGPLRLVDTVWEVLALETHCIVLTSIIRSLGSEDGAAM